MRILIVLRSLEFGGAERQVTVLAAALVQRGHQVGILSFYGGPMGDELRAAGVEVMALDRRGRWDLTRLALGVPRAVLQFRPDVIHGYLPAGNIAAMLAKLVRPHLPVVFGMRAATMDLWRYDRVTRAVYRVEAWLSHFCSLVIVNSQAAARECAARGVDTRRLNVVANGIDTARFRPDRALGAELRQELVGGGGRLIGFVGRLDPIKDEDLFLDVAAILASCRSDAAFVVVGDGPEQRSRHICERAVALGLGQRFRLLPAQRDVEVVYNALDLLVLTSRGESFPNVIAEAMACGVPVVATDVGDVAVVLGEWVVGGRDAKALASACLRRLGETVPSAEVRSRILPYSVDALATQTEALLSEACAEVTI